MRHYLFELADTVNQFFLQNKIIISYIGFGTSTAIFCIFSLLSIIKKLKGNKNNSNSS
ncbi:hypothetical protein [Bacillus sp. FJAT-49736]|uniref:hypothetical protein n=1 Tax=Bacillus sp. FJAT-49736 TaxID=2833582 RepID=UPI001BCA6632|nr:hypothetical protein [Bacillus sp. FJAT-49736]MBS4172275.1 hypothetical protein [Bacillus sp. FJAT-49736]